MDDGTPYTYTLTTYTSPNSTIPAESNILVPYTGPPTQTTPHYYNQSNFIATNPINTSTTTKPLISTALVPISPQKQMLEEHNTTSPMSDDTMYIDTSKLQTRNNQKQYHVASRQVTAKQVLSVIEEFIVRFYRQFQYAATKNHNLAESYKVRQSLPLSDHNLEYYKYLIKMVMAEDQMGLQHNSNHHNRAINYRHYNNGTYDQYGNNYLQYNPPSSTRVTNAPGLSTSSKIDGGAFVMLSDGQLLSSNSPLLGAASHLNPNAMMAMTPRSGTSYPQIGYNNQQAATQPNNYFNSVGEAVKRQMFNTPTISPVLTPTQIYAPVAVPPSYPVTNHNLNPYNRNYPNHSPFYHGGMGGGSRLEIEEVLDSPQILSTPHLAPAMSEINLAPVSTLHSTPFQHHNQNRHTYRNEGEDEDDSHNEYFSHLRPRLVPGGLVINQSYLPFGSVPMGSPPRNEDGFMTTSHNPLNNTSTHMQMTDGNHNNNNSNPTNTLFTHPLYQQMVAHGFHLPGQDSPTLSIVPMTLALSELSLHPTPQQSQRPQQP